MITRSKKQYKFFTATYYTRDIMPEDLVFLRKTFKSVSIGQKYTRVRGKKEPVLVKPVSMGNFAKPMSQRVNLKPKRRRRKSIIINVVKSLVVGITWILWNLLRFVFYMLVRIWKNKILLVLVIAIEIWLLAYIYLYGTKSIVQAVYIDPVTRIETAAVKVIEPTKAEAKVLGASDKDEVIAYINEKFGKDAEKGITMLRKCENGSLGTDRINKANRNGTWDVGVWQINVSPKDTVEVERLKDHKHNTDRAFDKYAAHGNTFYSWTCGNVVGDRTYVDALKGR